MRIISGKARGIKLETIEGLDTRPTTDRIKENVFNLINFFIKDAVVVDMFAGSGALGLECASRGASMTYLIDNSKKCEAVIKRNIDATKLSDSCKFVLSDVSASIKTFKKDSVDIIMMDPPYSKDLVNPLIRKIIDSGILTEDAIVIVEHDISDNIDTFDEYFEIHKFKKYGRTGITIFRRI